MVEYNQCQATLKNLYDLGIPGKVEEFTAYRILMLLHGRNRSGESPVGTSLANSCLLTIELGGRCFCYRIEFICRSANTETESG